MHVMCICVQVLEQFYRDGKARAIGVSNYSGKHLQELLDKAAVKPMVNQVCMAVQLPMGYNSDHCGRLQILTL